MSRVPILRGDSPQSVAIASAMQRAIAATGATSGDLLTVDLLTASECLTCWQAGTLNPEALLCLTFDVPEEIPFANRELYHLCRDPRKLRQRVAGWEYSTGEGNFWLPIVLTARGALYAEAIAERGEQFVQPFDLTDAQRQPLYALGWKLLEAIAAPPGVYLMQFGWQEEELEKPTVCFDRLIPFPDVPALASVGVQQPDLFTCHWLCVTKQPILDVVINGTS